MEIVFISAAVAGTTEFIKLLSDKRYSEAISVLAAALVGISAGLIGIEGITITQGLVAGLGAAGVYKVASKIGDSK